jgi:ribosomal protein S1
MQVIRQKQKKEFFTKIQPGDIYEGTVNGIAEFGAFVDIGYGVEGLVHLSELTYGRRRPVEEVVQKKDKVKVKVLKVDPETGKVSLSIKQTKPHPWETIEEDYPVGMILEGAVIRILTFGAIIELSEGVTGLLHISQISNDKIRKVEDVLNVGDVLKVRVLEVLKDERKVKLSMKGVEGNESLFGREPGQETAPVETGSDTDATDSTFVQPEVIQPEVIQPEVIQPEVIQPEVPAVDNVETVAAEPMSTEEVVQHEETEGPAEA